MIYKTLKKIILIRLEQTLQQKIWQKNLFLKLKITGQKQHESVMIKQIFQKEKYHKTSTCNK